MTDSRVGARQFDESCRAGRFQPIDREHLARQTMGDRAIEGEVLALFAAQAQTVRERIGEACTEERLRLAHGLKGSARGIGAFAVADCVAQIEEDPEDSVLIERLSVLIDQVRDFIAKGDR